MNDPSSLIGKTIVAYLRVSSDKQDSARQRTTIDAWAKRYGLSIAEYFQDDVGRNPRDTPSKRREFQRLLKAVERGTIDVVVVDSQDRFGTKNAHQFGKYVSQLAEHGVELWSTTEGNLSSDDPATILTSTVSAITSTAEQREKAHRNLSGKLEKARAGEYQGGYPPYGFDVVCFGTDGKEKWRVLYTGHHQRVKITGKRRETFAGKGNFPSKGPTDTLRVRPTIELDRLAVVKQIFRWADEEAISPTQIATRLNRTGVNSIFGDGWNKQKIKELLRNPVYIGLPTFNKRAGSRFAEFVGGQIRKVEGKKGRIVMGRRRNPTDYIQPDKPHFRAIVPPELFNRVQAKLDQSSKQHTNHHRRPPRTAELWLRGLLICGKCGEPMRGWNAKSKGQESRSYFCGTYGTYGKENPSGCRCHRVKADLIESIVQQYLDEAAKTVASLIKAVETQNPDTFTPLEAEYRTKHQQIWGLVEAMNDRVSAFSRQRGGERFLKDYMAYMTGGGESCPPRLSAQRNGTPLQSMFDYVHYRESPAIEARLDTLDAEHSQLVDRVLTLPATAKAAIAKANKRIVELEATMDAERAKLVNQADQFHDLMTDLAARKVAIESAKTSLGESGYRRKAELVRQVIDRIVCHFTYSETKAANLPKSTLRKVEVFPLVGDRFTCYPKGNKLGRG
jgi:DNA invertase Pin-like site-specific DNA recombinase